MKMGKWLQHLQAQNKNNRGYSILSVLVSVALVSLLIVTVLSLTTLNFQMKMTDRRARESFYSAETALDEVKLGLQREISQAFSRAYQKTMETYESLDAALRKEAFKTQYKQELRSALSEPADPARYSISHVTTYLDKTKWEEAARTGAQLSSTNNALNVTEEAVTLKNLAAQYTASGGVISQVKTDIVLAYPDMDFIESGSIPDLLSFGLIANEKFCSSGSHMTIEGNAYLGKDGAEFTTADVTFRRLTGRQDPGKIITGGSFDVLQGSVLSASDMEVWGSDILLDASKAALTGEVYLRNDLMLCSTPGAGSGKPAVSAEISGRYFGFGNPRTAKLARSQQGNSEIDLRPADYSSSVIVNGIHATVDFSGLEELMLAGNSYIGASGKTAEGMGGYQNHDIQMGESITVKGNQSAYLVPPECVAPESDEGGRNPMTAQQYQELCRQVEEGKLSGLVDYEMQSPLLQSSLAQLGVTGYQVACYPVRNVGSMVYLFLDLPENLAPALLDQYGGDPDNLRKLQETIDLYTKKIRLPQEAKEDTGAKFYFQGNVVINDESADTFYQSKTMIPETAGQGAREEKQKEYQDQFAALGKKLVKDYDSLTPEEKSKDLYGNLVKQSMEGLGNQQAIPSGSARTFKSAGNQPLTAVVANGDYTIDREEVSGGKLRVVIASGDVTLKKDFQGLILAGGTVKTAAASLNLTASPSDAAVALLAEDASGVRPFDYLKGLKEYVIGGLGSAGGTAENQKISDMVTFENWSKQ